MTAKIPAIAQRTFAASTCTVILVSNFFIGLLRRKSLSAPRPLAVWQDYRGVRTTSGALNVTATLSSARVSLLLSVVAESYQRPRHSAEVNNLDSGRVERPYRSGSARPTMRVSVMARDRCHQMLLVEDATQLLLYFLKEHGRRPCGTTDRS